MFHTHLLRSLSTLFVGLFVMFTAVHFQYNSMGALGCLAIGFVAARRWTDGGMGWLSKAPNGHWPHEVENDIASIWRHFAQPLLFSVIGKSKIRRLLLFFALDFVFVFSREN